MHVQYFMYVYLGRQTAQSYLIPHAVMSQHSNANVASTGFCRGVLAPAGLLRGKKGSFVPFPHGNPTAPIGERRADLCQQYHLCKSVWTCKNRTSLGRNLGFGGVGIPTNLGCGPLPSPLLYTNKGVEKRTALRFVQNHSNSGCKIAKNNWMTGGVVAVLLPEHLPPCPPSGTPLGCTGREACANRQHCI